MLVCWLANGVVVVAFCMYHAALLPASPSSRSTTSSLSVVLFLTADDCRAFSDDCLTTVCRASSDDCLMTVVLLLTTDDNSLSCLFWRLMTVCRAYSDDYYSLSCFFWRLFDDGPSCFFRWLWRPLGPSIIWKGKTVHDIFLLLYDARQVLQFIETHHDGYHSLILSPVSQMMWCFLSYTSAVP